MAVARACPACGLESDQLRCPRCNALKVVGCAGECSACRTGCRPQVPSTDLGCAPSIRAREDPVHAGTPLEG
jgi:hypothetical protein